MKRNMWFSVDIISASVFILIPIAVFLLTTTQQETPILLGIKISQTPEPDLFGIGQWLLLIAPAVFCSIRYWMMQNAIIRFTVLRVGGYRKWWYQRMFRILFFVFLYSLYSILLFMLHSQMRQYWISYLVLFNLHLDVLCMLCIILSSILKNGIGFVIVFIMEGLGYILAASDISLNRYMFTIFGMVARSESMSSDFGYSMVGAVVAQLLIITIMFMLPKKTLEWILQNNNKEKIK